ncbi:hypothetical protein PATSB16_06270 [Pandoraea thiooxydans]|nr:hypothetical protein PATSB16_06270 [Pandoraea thiooxydans]
MVKKSNHTPDSRQTARAVPGMARTERFSSDGKTKKPRGRATGTAPRIIQRSISV